MLEERNCVQLKRAEAAWGITQDVHFALSYLLGFFFFPHCLSRLGASSSQCPPALKFGALWREWCISDLWEMIRYTVEEETTLDSIS